MQNGFPGAESLAHCCAGGKRCGRPASVTIAARGAGARGTYSAPGSRTQDSRLRAVVRLRFSGSLSSGCLGTESFAAALLSKTQTERGAIAEIQSNALRPVRRVCAAIPVSLYANGAATEHRALAMSAQPLSPGCNLNVTKVIFPGPRLLWKMLFTHDQRRKRHCLAEGQAQGNGRPRGTGGAAVSSGIQQP